MGTIGLESTSARPLSTLLPPLARLEIGSSLAHCSGRGSHMLEDVLSNNALERIVNQRGRTARAFAVCARAGAQWLAQLGR